MRDMFSMAVFFTGFLNAGICDQGLVVDHAVQGGRQDDGILLNNDVGEADLGIKGHASLLFPVLSFVFTVGAAVPVAHDYGI